MLPKMPGDLHRQYHLLCLEAKRDGEKWLALLDQSDLQETKHLDDVTNKVVECVTVVFRLAERATVAEAILERSSRLSLCKEIERIHPQTELALGAAYRNDPEAFLQHTKKQLVSYDWLALQVKRMQAQMHYINRTLELIQFTKRRDLLPENERSIHEYVQVLEGILQDLEQFERGLDKGPEGDEIGSA